VLRESVEKAMCMSVWVLVWEIEVVVRTLVEDVPRETMIPGIRVLRGVVTVLVGC